MSKQLAIGSMVLVLIILTLMGCEPKKTNLEIHPEWKEQFPGVYQANVKPADHYTLLDAANRKPREERLNQFAEAIIPIENDEIRIQVHDGKTIVRFPLDREEQIFGLGLNFSTIFQRGRIMRLHVDHYGGKDNGRNHAPVPFFLSSKGYGVLINAARYIDVYVGTGVTKDSENPPEVKDRNRDRGWSARPYSDNLEFVIPQEGVEMILFAGHSNLEVVQKFNLYSGGGIIPPKWGLGFWQRTPTRFNQDQVMDEIKGFHDFNFPLDVIGLEPGWHSKAYPCTFEWDSIRFPDPDDFSSTLLNEGIRLNLWMNPYLWPGCELDQQMKNYIGSHTVWCGHIPDYTIPEARKIFSDHLKSNQVDIGISGFKVDEVDGFDTWLWPDAASFPSGYSAEQMRQTYGMQVMTIIDDLYRAENKRSYGLVRAANAGSVSLPFVLYNDSYSHQEFIIALINSGFSGLLWTPEVRASGSSAEWARRMQTVCFSPLAMINAWADGTKPWSFPDVYEICQDAAFLRMQLLPYLYSCFASYYFDGKPPFRAMYLCDDFTPSRKEINDQYMVGDALLIAPLFGDETTRNVILPKGKWYDFYSGDLVGEDEIISTKAELDKIPVFVKDGGIIPMIPPIRQTSQWGEKIPLDIRIYGTADNSFLLYDDDGESYGFENNDYTVKKILLKEGKTGIETIHESSWWSYGQVSWTQMSK